LDSETLELPYWLFKFEELVDVVYAGRTPSPEAFDAFYDVIKTAKSRFSAGAGAQLASSAVRRQPSADAANIGADTPAPFRVADAIHVIDEFLGKLEEPYPRHELRALKNRLEALNRDPRYRFMFSRFVEDSLAKTLSGIFRMPMAGKPVTIVQLAGLPNEVVNAVVSVVARLCFEVALWSSGKYEVLLLCEEAHRYIPADARYGFLPTRSAIGRIAKEGRKYGAALGIVTQRPSELDSTVLSQCSTMFAMRLSNEADKAIIRAAVSGSSTSTVAFLSSLADREAIAFGEAVPTPMRMKFGDYSVFEAADNGAPAEPPHIDVRQIVSALRGELELAYEANAPEPTRLTPRAVELAQVPSRSAEGGFGIRVAR
jgi:DNA helicase HerA-like ATPase